MEGILTSTYHIFKRDLSQLDLKSTSNFMANTGIELDFPLKKNFDLIVVFEAGKYFDDAIISDFINLKQMVYTIEIGGRIILDFKK